MTRVFPPLYFGMTAGGRGAAVALTLVGLAACLVVVLRQRSVPLDGLAASQLFIHEFKAGEVYPRTAQLSAVPAGNPYPHDAQVINLEED
jgi:hypothetical protein